jgi:transcriptional regulator with XRE-family HTH domain
MKNIGDNLKTIRIQKKMTLQELSQRAKVSKSQLSQIERNASVPTVTKLIDIAGALNVTLSTLFPENESSGREKPLSNRNEDKNNRSKRIEVVRKGARKKLLTPWGASYEMLCPDLQHRIEFIILHYPVGVKVEEPYVHEGEECGLVLEGTFKGTFGDREIILKPGDSICYESSIPHRWEAIGDTDVKAIWAITPPSF